MQVCDEDMACDALAFAACHDNPFPLILEALTTSLDSEYLEIDECGAVEAYTVLLLGLKDYSIIDGMNDEQLGAPYRKYVDTFVTKNKAQWGESIDHGLYLNSAKDALDAVLSERSESRELWEETEYIDDWLAVTRGLKEKL